MFYIHTRKRLASNTFLLHLLPAGAVFITVLGLALLGWRNARDAYRVERDSAVAQMVSQTQNDVVDRLENYELMLMGASGLFVASEDVSRQEWNQFVKIFRVAKNYPGIQGVGYAIEAKQADIPRLTALARKDGYKNFKVFPAGSRDRYVINFYFDPVNVSGLGYDMMSEPNRREAILRAQKEGEGSITGKLGFVRSNDSLGATGFSMYMPVYVGTGVGRHISGYVFAPITAGQFFPTALDGTDSTRYGLRVYDGVADQNAILFQTANFDSYDGDAITHTAKLDLFGQSWLIDYRISSDIVSETTQNRPTSSLLVGIMLSFLLSGFVLTLLVARTRVLAHSKQLEVQDAKDELLSLASHQLRTPATSVKQYLAMALDGFAGKLRPQQLNLLEKAFESNERQLHIINEILYVAKLDAKGIVLTPRKIHINKLIRDLVQEMSATAKKTGQKIRLEMPKRQVYITADEHCLRMALENLISNGLKYSHEGTTVSVKVTAGKDNIVVRVKDKGVGIEPEDMAMLFQRFSRIPNELSRQTSGSGIGLYLSQQLIELHNGTIEVESAKGKGTTFTVTIPKAYDGSRRKREV